MIKVRNIPAANQGPSRHAAFFLTIAIAATVMAPGIPGIAGMTLFGEIDRDKVSQDQVTYYLRMGNFFYVNGNSEAAAQFFKSALDLKPLQRDLYPLLGSIYEAAGKSDEAAEVYSKGLELFPEDEKTLLFLGIFHDRRGEFEKAIEIFSRIMKNNPDSTNALNCMAESFIRAGEFDEAAKILEKGLKRVPDNFILHHNMGWAEYEKHDYDKAMGHLEKALELNPTFPLTYTILGNVHYNSGRNDEAVKAFEKAIELAPDNLDAHIFLGEILFVTKQYEKASEILKKAVMMGAGSPKILVGLAWCLYSMGDADDARRHAEIVMKSVDGIDSASTLNDLGWLLVKLGRGEEGAALLEKAVNLDPAMEVALSNLFYTCNEAGDFPRALGVAEKIRAQRPDSPGAVNSVGWLKFKNQDIDGAIEVFRETIALDPNFALAYNNLGLMYYLKDDLKGAFDWYSKAAAVPGANPESVAYSYNNMALIDFKLQKTKEAEANFHKSLKACENYVPAMNNLGILLNTLKRDKEAADLYRKIIALDRDPEETLIARFQLALILTRTEDFDGALPLLSEVSASTNPELAYKADMVTASINYRLGKYAETIKIYKIRMKDAENVSEVALSLGNVYFKIGDLDAAENYFKIALEGDDENPTILNSLAYLLAVRSKSLKEALELVDKAIAVGAAENDPDSMGAYYDTKGWIHFQNDECEKALEFTKKSLTTFTNREFLEEVYYHLAMIHIKLGEIPEAVKALREAVAVNPATEFGRKSRALLDIMDPGAEPEGK